MKKHLSVLIAVAAILAGTSCPAEDKTQVSARSGLHYEWWGSNDDASGTQFYVPVKVAASRSDFTVSVLGAYMFTQVNPEDGKRRSLSQMSDTKLNLSYRLYDKLPLDVLFGLGFNLPTGHTDLTQSQMTLLVPPDLFSIPYFGEGFNINPTIVLAKEWDGWTAGVGVGYTWKGEYDYNFEIKDYDPGDLVTVTAEIDRELSPNLLARLFAQYIHYSKDTVHGEDFYQEGDVRLIGTGLSYSRDTWDLAFTVTGIFRDKSRLSDGPTLPIVTEDRKSHGNEFNAGLAYRYRTDAKTALKASLVLLYIGENDYPEDSPNFAGKREKATLGCGIDRILAENLTGSLGIEGFVMADEENWYHPDEDVTYYGISLSALVSKKF
ncbi:MAG TPA: hypothetical protein PLA18_04655 [Deltaproteobacteria bacterium]|jgi:hypothetical protein|nr:hypothetical protein [Deltaproteobacteria bacterium]